MWWEPAGSAAGIPPALYRAVLHWAAQGSDDASRTRAMFLSRDGMLKVEVICRMKPECVLLREANVCKEVNLTPTPPNIECLLHARSSAKCQTHFLCFNSHSHPIL